MKNFFYLLTVFLIIPEIIFATNSITINSNEIFDFQKGKSKISKYPNLQNSSDIVAFELKNNNLSSVFSQNTNNLTIKQFPISGYKTADIVLNEEFEDYSKFSKVIVYENNQKRQIKTPKTIMYSGKIVGEDNSYISLVLSNGYLFGYIKQNDGTVHSISPSQSNDANLHILVPHITEKDLAPDESPIFDCQTEDYHGDANEFTDMIKYSNETLQSNKNKLLEANIICEGAYDFYRLLGSDVDKVTAYMYSVMAFTSKIYTENLNIKISVSEVHIRLDAPTDPYYNGTKNLSEKLMTMPSVWSKYSSSRALVVLFADLSNQPANTVIAGISMGGNPYQGSICSKSNGYCVLGIKHDTKYNSFQYSWDVNVAAHEMGHNFSAPHTHNCYFSPNMIDTCVTRYLPMPVYDACVTSGQPKPVPGTIMSYCHVSNSTRTVELYFHPRQIPLLRTAAENCNCMNSNIENLALLEPLGGARYRYGDDMKIRWASANVKNINILLSLDNGKTWGVEIAKNINANDSIITIPVPNLNTDSALVKIVDTSDPDLLDISLFTFSIHNQQLVFVVPKEGDSFSTEENLYSIWRQNFNDSLRLEFTSDGGASWKTVLESTLDKYETEPLGIVSDKCKFRLTSIFDGTTVESAMFSIGEPSAKIISPNGDEVWYSNTKQTIKWESNNLFECFLEYSINNGKNWKRVILSRVPASDKVFEWTIPNITSDSALVRILPPKSGSSPFDFSDKVFKIIPDPTDVLEDMQISNSIIINSVTPNPINKFAEINISNSSSNFEDCKIILSDVLGKSNMNLGLIQLAPNSTINHQINISGISQGNYFIILKSKFNTISYPVKIVK